MPTWREIEAALTAALRQHHHSDYIDQLSDTGDVVVYMESRRINLTVLAQDIAKELST